MTDIVETNKPTSDKRIPSLLSRNAILGSICLNYMTIVDEISAYNKEVLAEKDADWNAAKVLEKSRELGRPTDPKAEANAEIKAALEAFENAATVLSQARKALIDTTAKELGVTLSATGTRDADVEAPLKDKRKIANEIGNQLKMLSQLSTDESASTAVNSFLENNPLPAVGRDQVRSFGNDGATTPKYRVTVEVLKNGDSLGKFDGFTKAKLALTKPEFGYERGKAPTSDDLRKAWENAGNSAEETKSPTVEFDDNDLHYVITKK